MINVQGLEVPVVDTAFGPCLVSGGDRKELEWLEWFINAGLNGDLLGLADSIERGEAVDRLPVFGRPAAASDDLEARSRQWRERTGGELGNDAYAVSTLWSSDEFFLPRAVLIELIRRLEQMRAAAPKPPSPWLFTLNSIYHDPHPDEEVDLRALEPRAAEFDRLASTAGDLEHTATVAAKRRFLLAELEQYGLLTATPQLSAVNRGEHRARWLERWGLPTLASYARAAVAIKRYWESVPRYSRIGPPDALIALPSILGTTVSADWFRFAVPTPPGWHSAEARELDVPAPAAWDDADWLAFCERTLIDARLGDAYSGELFVHTGNFRCVIAWRRDDGVHACVVSARVR